MELRLNTPLRRIETNLIERTFHLWIDDRQAGLRLFSRRNRVLGRCGLFCRRVVAACTGMASTHSHSSRTDG